MVSRSTRLDQAQASIRRLTRHLAEFGVPAAAIQALVDNTDPGPCPNVRGVVSCQLDLGHPHSHMAVYPPAPGSKTQTEWAYIWSDNDIEKHLGPYHQRFTLPGPETPAMRAHAELVDDKRVLICQPVTRTLLHVCIRLGRNDTGLYTWLCRIGLQRGQAQRTEDGDYLARGQRNGARITLTAFAHSYR